MAVNGIEEMNGEIFSDNLVGLGEEGGSLEPSEPDGNQDQVCNICDNKLTIPRVLSCLHVFCEACLEKKIINGAGDSITYDRILVCPNCKQETKVGSAGVATLLTDYILTNILDPAGMETAVCTCCKSKDQAVARCSDCLHFLCFNCTSAHEFMRCFENHRVVSFDAIKNSNDTSAVHRPIFCNVHTGEALSYYCHICEEAVCQECMVRGHKAGSAHQCEKAAEAEASLRRQLLGLTRRAAAKADDCQRTTERLGDSLAELQRQRDEAKSLIRESFQSYKAVLEMAYDRALQQLERLHSERELKVMDLCNNVDKTVQKIEDACKFTARLLKLGDATEIAILKKVISSQMMYLVSNTPKTDVNISLEFETNYEKFESMIQENFGKFKTESYSNDSADSGITQGEISLTASPPAVMTVTMQNSMEEYAMGATSPLAPPLPPLSSIAEYNLQQLASLAEKEAPPPLPHASPAPPPFILADLLAGDLTTTHAFNNLQALAKLGLNTEVNGGGVVVPVGPGRSPPLLMGGAPSPRPPSLGPPPSGMSGPDESLSGAGTAAPFPRTTKAAPMHIRFKFGQLGGGKGQFNSPHGFCLGNEEDIIVADTNNHRITIFEKTGTYKFHFGAAGKEEGQLWYPRKVAVMRATGKFVVCDRGSERSRMQIFTKNGHFLKKIAVRYIDIVAGLAVTQQGNIVAVDSVTPTVFVISENGDLLSWFDCSECMREPSDIAISGKEFFVCDFKGHCVVVFSEDGKFLRRIGCENITNFPNGIDVSDAGDVLIGDSHGNKFHVAVFSRDGSLVTEFECPYVKVSRCCGLKITSEGYIVTLAKNNHHVLVLNTLYIV